MKAGQRLNATKTEIVFEQSFLLRSIFIGPSVSAIWAGSYNKSWSTSNNWSLCWNVSQLTAQDDGIGRVIGYLK